MTTRELCRVLIVDDEILIRQGIKHYINWEQEGFLIVGEASNGTQALELLEETKPHIIITDIVMPIMDGEEFTRIVKEKYPKIEMIILSSFGEFDYVRSTFQSGVVDYILKPKLDAEGMLKALKKAASRIPIFQNMDRNSDVNFSIGQRINRLISGYELNSEHDSTSNVFPHSHFYLLGTEARPDAHDLDDLKGKIAKSLNENLMSAAHFAFQPDQNRVVFIINVNHFDQENVVEFAKHLAGEISNVGFALSEEFFEFKQIGDIYNGSIIKLLQYQFYFPNQALLMTKNLPKQPKLENFNLDWFTSEFKNKRFEAAFQYLSEHVTTLSRCYTMNPFEYKAFFGNIIFNITILLSNMEYTIGDLENAKYYYFKSIDEVNTAQEAIILLNQFIGQAKKCISVVEKEPDLHIKKVMDYIVNHYAEPLTLTEVAHHFHFNPSYLSSYFSSHNNEGFIEYLNKIRIEKASNLLLQREISISEISGLVGYSDQSYFCKVFKKLMGSSPSQYRRRYFMK